MNVAILGSRAEEIVEIFLLGTRECSVCIYRCMPDAPLAIVVFTGFRKMCPREQALVNGQFVGL